MATKHRRAFTVREDGTLEAIHTDELAPVIMDLMADGEGIIERASHVEPNRDGKWVVDLAPIGGPVLEPVDSRADALQNEVNYLEAHYL